MGYFCLGGTNVETLCPLGYYSDQVKVAAETDSDPSVRQCTICPAGHKCDAQPLFAPIPCGVGNH